MLKRFEKNRTIRAFVNEFSERTLRGRKPENRLDCIHNS
jgi:hypothetical protein